jgi:hypothetical protein
MFSLIALSDAGCWLGKMRDARECLGNRKPI